MHNGVAGSSSGTQLNMIAAGGARGDNRFSGGGGGGVGNPIAYNSR